MVIQRGRVKELVPPVVMLAHGKLGAIAHRHCVWDYGRKIRPLPYGLSPWGEQTYSEVHRVFTETVNGVKQGAAFRFLKGREVRQHWGAPDQGRAVVLHRLRSRLGRSRRQALEL